MIAVITLILPENFMVTLPAVQLSSLLYNKKAG
jgi:hypothetical protein